MLTGGDRITLPVNLRNYAADAITLPIAVKAEDWFTLSIPAKSHAAVLPNVSAPVLVGLRVILAVDSGPPQITAASAYDVDAVERAVEGHPDGEPRTATASALQGNSANAIRFDLSADAIAG